MAARITRRNAVQVAAAPRRCGEEGEAAGGEQKDAEEQQAGQEAEVRFGMDQENNRDNRQAQAHQKHADVEEVREHAERGRGPHLAGVHLPADDARSFSIPRNVHSRFKSCQGNAGLLLVREGSEKLARGAHLRPFGIVCMAVAFDAQT